jgi:hypothetical protein
MFGKEAGNNRRSIQYLCEEAEAVVLFTVGIDLPYLQKRKGKSG